MFEIQNKLYSLTIETEIEGQHTLYTTQLSVSVNPRENFRALAKKYPDAKIFTGSINGNKIPVDDLPMTASELESRLDELICTERYKLSLYVTGGFYPRKDGLQVFSLEKPSGEKENFYVYGRTPWTSLPLYKVEDDCLVRVKPGEIPSPKKYPMEEWIQTGISKALENKRIY